MNIMELHSFDNWDGPALVLLGLVKGLRKLGQQVIIVTNEWHGIDRAKAVGPVITLNTPKLRYRDAFAIAVIIKRHDIDIIHTHGGKTSWIALVAAAIAGRGKVVNTWHGIRKFKDNVLHRWFYGQVAVVAVSEMLRNRIIRESGGLIKEVHTVHNAIDVEEFRPVPNDIRTRYSIPGDAFVVGFFGRLHPEKGVEYLLQAVKSLQNVYVLLVGWETEPEYVKRLREIAGDNVKFCGYTPDVRPYMSAIDVLVLPSICQESFGSVICESMAIGKPVISTNTGGQTEIIIDEKNGFLVSPQSAEEIAAKLQTLITDKRLYDRMRDESEKLVREKFTLEVMAGNTLNLFHSLCKKPAHSAVAGFRRLKTEKTL